MEDSVTGGHAKEGMDPSLRVKKIPRRPPKISFPAYPEEEMNKRPGVISLKLSSQSGSRSILNEDYDHTESGDADAHDSYVPHVVRWLVSYKTNVFEFMLIFMIFMLDGVSIGIWILQGGLR